MFSWCEKRLYQITITYSPRLTPPSCKHRVRAPPTLNLIMINTRVLFPCQTKNYTHQAWNLRCPDGYRSGSNSDFLLFVMQWFIHSQCFHHYTTFFPAIKLFAIIVTFAQFCDSNVFRWIQSGRKQTGRDFDTPLWFYMAEITHFSLLLQQMNLSRDS